MNIILQPQGNLDLKVSALLQQKISALVADQYNHYLIDLTRVKSLNHCGVIALFSADRLARKMGKRLSLCNLNSSVQYVLEISDLAGELEILEADNDTLTVATTILV